MQNFVKYITTPALLVATLSINACNYSTDPYNNNDTVMNGTIEGSAWAAINPAAERSGTSTVSVLVFGSDAQDREISVTVVGATTSSSPVTYQVGAGQPAVVSLTIGTQQWPGTGAVGATGSVTLTTLTSSSMQPLTESGATGTRHLIGTFTAYF
jgi:hypothetical protein